MKTERRPRTIEETAAIKLMASISYPVASFDKRFMRSVSSVETITAKESAQLWRLFIRYRRQTPNTVEKMRLLIHASDLAAPDLRKLAAAAREQAEIDAQKAKLAAAFNVSNLKPK